MLPALDAKGLKSVGHLLVGGLGHGHRHSVRHIGVRHTYRAARLQTLDAGAPVSPYALGKELGQGGDALARKVYGHLGIKRNPADVVEYRVEQQATNFLTQRLAILRGPAASSENDPVPARPR